MKIFYSLIIILALTISASAIDKGLQLFRVGTGPSAGNSYLVGIQLAGFISKPAGKLSCEHSGLCGVPGLIASTQTQSGFIDGINSLRNGKLEALLMPADIAHAAYQGSGLFENFKPYKDLRVFASLKPEYLHIIVRKDSNIESLKDLKHMKISTGWKQSGMPILAKYILSLHGVEPQNITSYYLDANESLDSLTAGEIDAAFLMETTGADNITQLFRNADVKLLTLTWHDLLSLPIVTPFMDTAVIRKGQYGNPEPVTTLSIDLLWITRENLRSDLIEKITHALWNDDRARSFLKWSHLDHKERAILHLERGNIDGIPFHSGSRDYFLKLTELEQR